MYLSRLVAPVAALLLSAAPGIASAASLNVDIPGCSQVQLSGSGPSYTITCTQSTMTCVAQSSPVSPQGNTSASLTVACQPAATAVTWQASRDCTTPTATGVGQATVTEAGGRSCVYTAVATNSNGNGSAAAAVVWQSASTAPPPNAPSGCSITRTPSNGSLGSSGGAISVAGSCTGGGAVTSWTWRKNGQNWATTQNANDTLPANTATTPITYTYGLVACNGSSCAGEVTTTFTVAGSSGQATGFCADPRYTNVVFVDLNWGGGGVQTSGAGGVTPGTLVVGRLTIPQSLAGAKRGLVSVVEYSDPPAFRVMSLSTQPCDLLRTWSSSAYPTDPTGNSAPLAWAIGQTPGLSYGLAGGVGTPVLQPGVTYYVNILSINPSTGLNDCNGSCNMLLTNSVYNQ